MRSMRMVGDMAEIRKVDWNGLAVVGTCAESDSLPPP
jgi:hypothetical protein